MSENSFYLLFIQLINILFVYLIIKYKYLLLIIKYNILIERHLKISFV